MRREHGAEVDEHASDRGHGNAAYHRDVARVEAETVMDDRCPQPADAAAGRVPPGLSAGQRDTSRSAAAHRPAAAAPGPPREHGRHRLRVTRQLPATVGVHAGVPADQHATLRPAGDGVVRQAARQEARRWWSGRAGVMHKFRAQLVFCASPPESRAAHSRETRRVCHECANLTARGDVQAQPREDALDGVLDVARLAPQDGRDLALRACRRAASPAAAGRRRSRRSSASCMTRCARPGQQPLALVDEPDRLEQVARGDALVEQPVGLGERRRAATAPGRRRR